MQIVSAQQVKAARALLGWKQEDLAAAASLSLSAVRNFEVGYMPRISTTVAIYKAIENAGIEFTQNDGVRRCTSELRLYRGADRCTEFLDGVLEMVKEEQSEILLFVRDVETLIQPCWSPRGTNLQRFEKISQEVNVKCLLLDEFVPNVPSCEFELRICTKEIIGPPCVFVYGNKYAYLIPEGHNDCMILAFNIITVALDYRNQFLTSWADAVPAFAKKKIHSAVRARYR